MCFIHKDVAYFYREMSKALIMKLKSPFPNSVVWKKYIWIFIGRVLKQIQAIKYKTNTYIFFHFLLHALIQFGAIDC